MENKYDIRVNPPDWKEEQIDKHKDFEALMQRYERASSATDKEPSGKQVNMNQWMGIALMAAVVSLLLWVGSKALEEDIAGATDLSTELALLKPMPQIQESKQKTSVNVLKGDTLLAESGSRLIIPPAAFQDAAGNALKGTVDVEYIEHSDFVDVFLSGAQMRKDKARQLETAGLLEIQARQNGETVYLKSDKAIQVELKSLLPTAKATLAYEVQRYDLQEQVWKYQAEGNKQVEKQRTTEGDVAEPEAAGTTSKGEGPSSKEALRARIAARIAKPQKPIAPDAANQENYVLELDIKPEEFPNLAKYGKILWEVDQANYKESWDKIAWDNFDVKELPDGSYTLTLSTAEQQAQMPVKPVSPNTRATQKLYEEELRAYEQALAQREEAINTELSSMESSVVPPTRDTVAMPAAAAYRWVMHSFSITELGLWGCNRLLERPELQRRYDLELPAGTELQMVYMANEEHNTIYRLAVDENGQVRVPISQGKQVLWALDAQNQLLRLPNELPKDGSLLRLEEKAVFPQTEEELRRVLAFNS